MALDARYMIAPCPQDIFVDPNTGEPISNGRVFLYKDVDHNIPKTAYTLSKNGANYSYVPLPQPIVLGGGGTALDANGNDVKIYYYVLNEDDPTETELYFMRVQDELGAKIFTRNAWPNASVSGSPGDINNIENFIPNGQFLTHTSLPDNALVAGSNVIAQGGFSVELPDPVASVNTIQFIEQGFTESPPQSPRFICQLGVTTFSALDSHKWFRIKFRDVNKFSAEPDDWTFSFWSSSNVNIPVSIQTYKFFGTNGSPPVISTQSTETITPTPQTLNVSIDFGTNAGFTIDTVNNDDYIAIDIAFPVTLGFQVSLANFVLANGNLQIEGFPVETDAEMLGRSIFGWVERPDSDGFDLYLNTILTKEGLIFDREQVGCIEEKPFPVEDPAQTNPIPQHNMLNCDGSTYVSEEYAANGIPFKRLGDYLINNDPNGIPLYGTGTNYVTSFGAQSGAITNTFDIWFNDYGTGSLLALDGASPTNFNFNPIVVYGGSSTGIADLQYDSYIGSTSATPNRFYCFKRGSAWISNPTAGTSGFSISIPSNLSSLTAFGLNYFYVTTLSAAALSTGIGNPARYMTFSTNTTNYYIWFNIAGETDPSPGGTGIQVFLDIAHNAQDVADILVQVMNGYNGTRIDIPGAPSPSSYFLYYSNPSSVRNFYLWYRVDSVGSDPALFGASGIMVDILSADTSETIRDKTILAINAYQYQVPDFEGMFFRGYDPNLKNDPDANARLSNVPFRAGAVPGTFQYDQFRSHNHHLVGWAVSGADDLLTTAAPVGGSRTVTSIQNSGGNETRPVNESVVRIIRY